MSSLSIPHIPPIRFVKSLISGDAKYASVEVGFDTIPTLGMLVEAAAQSSSGIVSEESGKRVGFLITLKNIKLLQEPKSTEFIVNIELLHRIEGFKSFSFEVVEDEDIVATGSFSIALQ